MKKNRPSKRTIAVRVLAGILCALMVLGTFAILLPTTNHDHDSETTTQH